MLRLDMTLAFKIERLNSSKVFVLCGIIEVCLCVCWICKQWPRPCLLSFDWRLELLITVRACSGHSLMTNCL